MITGAAPSRRQAEQRSALRRAVYWGPVRAAFRVIGPSYLLMLIAGGFVFGGQGLHPRTLVDWMAETGWGLVLLCGMWWLFSGRGYRAAAADPAVHWLRALPLTRGAWLSALAPWVLVIEAPWLALWAIGAQDWRCSFGVLTACLGLVGHLYVATHRPRTRRNPPRSAWLELALAQSRGVLRRFPVAFVVLGAGWALATALCLTMSGRHVEPLATRLEFVATTLGLASLVSAASLRWLLHDELRRLGWLLAASPTGVASTVVAEVLTSIGPTTLALVGCLTVIAT